MKNFDFEFMVMENEEVVTLGEVRRRFKELDEVEVTNDFEWDEWDKIACRFEKWANDHGYYFIPDLYDWFTAEDYDKVMKQLEEASDWMPEGPVVKDELPF